MLLKEAKDFSKEVNNEETTTRGEEIYE